MTNLLMQTSLNILAFFICSGGKGTIRNKKDLPGQVVGTFQHDATSQEAKDKLLKNESTVTIFILFERIITNVGSNFSI